MSPRELRTLEALLAGPLSRELLDRVAGCSNGPMLVARLRAIGLELPCAMLPAIDRDGEKVRHGEYSLTAADRVRARALLAGEAVPAQLPGQLSLPGLPAQGAE